MNSLRKTCFQTKDVKKNIATQLQASCQCHEIGCLSTSLIAQFHGQVQHLIILRYDQMCIEINQNRF